MYQGISATQAAMERPKVKALLTQLKELQQKKLDDEIAKAEATIVADIRKQIIELGGTPCE